MTTIAILTNEHDFAADSVIAHLHEFGATVERLNIESARLSAVPTWHPGGVSSPPVVWWRQFEIDVAPTNLHEADDVLVERAQWRAWLSTMHAAESRWVNDLWAARRAENKVLQLRVATDLGFDVPETLITNDRDEALRFQSSTGEAVVKTVASAYFSFSDQSFVFTESLEHPELNYANRWHRAPLIVQRRIKGALDARIVSFGDHTFAAQCAVEGIDWRKTPYRPNLWSTWTPPRHLSERCRRYREELGLEYAAFDFMTDEVGTWFLEANQAGEFSFLDRALDLGIASALAEHLVELGND